jgi:hypothetical protein
MHKTVLMEMKILYFIFKNKDCNVQRTGLNEEKKFVLMASHQVNMNLKIINLAFTL